MTFSSAESYTISNDENCRRLLQLGAGRQRKPLDLLVFRRLARIPVGYCTGKAGARFSLTASKASRKSEINSCPSSRLRAISSAPCRMRISRSRSRTSTVGKLLNTSILCYRPLLTGLKPNRGPVPRKFLPLNTEFLDSIPAGNPEQRMDTDLIFNEVRRLSIVPMLEVLNAAETKAR